MAWTLRWPLRVSVGTYICQSMILTGETMKVLRAGRIRSVQHWVAIMVSYDVARIKAEKQQFALNGVTAIMYCWPNPEQGIRVAEVSISTNRAGASWMQSDPDGLAV